MTKKDKFQQLKGGGIMSSFQDMANTVAAIEKQASKTEPATETPAAPEKEQTPQAVITPSTERLTHLPNPSIPQRLYNLASQYCCQFDNMTRQDWMEMAIVEKLHNDGLIPDDEFNMRHNEIRSRLPRGQRKYAKNK